jgi:hypothetical protein
MLHHSLVLNSFVSLVMALRGYSKTPKQLVYGHSCIPCEHHTPVSVSSVGRSPAEFCGGLANGTNNGVQHHREFPCAPTLSRSMQHQCMVAAITYSCPSSFAAVLFTYTAPIWKQCCKNRWLGPKHTEHLGNREMTRQ